jgi:hypothetical protein
MMADTSNGDVSSSFDCCPGEKKPAQGGPDVTRSFANGSWLQIPKLPYETSVKAP